MSSEGGDASFVRVGPSRTLAWILTWLHLGAAACALVAELPAGVRAAAVAGVAASLAFHLIDDAGRALPGSVIGMAWDARGEWRLATRSGTLVRARLLAGGCAHPSLIVLRFRTGAGRRVRVVILPDAVDAECMRRVRRRLRTASRA